MLKLITDQSGNFSSQLLFRLVWQLVTVIVFAYYVITDKIEPFEAIAMAATFSGFEGVSYLWRRGQDRKVGK